MIAADKEKRISFSGVEFAVTFRAEKGLPFIFDVDGMLEFHKVVNG